MIRTTINLVGVTAINLKLFQELYLWVKTIPRTEDMDCTLKESLTLTSLRHVSQTRVLICTGLDPLLPTVSTLWHLVELLHVGNVNG